MTVAYKVTVAIVPGRYGGTRVVESEQDFLDELTGIDNKNTSIPAVLQNIIDIKRAYIFTGDGTHTCRETLIGDLYNANPLIKIAIHCGNSVLVRVKCRGSDDIVTARYIDSLSGAEKEKASNFLSIYMFKTVGLSHIYVAKSDSGQVLGLDMYFHVNPAVSWITLSASLLIIRVFPEIASSDTYKTTTNSNSIGSALMAYASTIESYDKHSIHFTDIICLAVMSRVKYQDMTIDWMCGQNGPSNCIMLDSFSRAFWSRLVLEYVMMGANRSYRPIWLAELYRLAAYVPSLASELESIKGEK